VTDEKRMYQYFLYLQGDASQPDSNHYALPLPISPVVCTETMSVIKVDILPTGADNSDTKLKPYISRPLNEYVPESQKLRTDLKPLRIVQPEGTSFSVLEQEGTSVLSWQKWSMRIGFNYREGMVLHDVGRHQHCPPFFLTMFRYGMIIEVYSTALLCRR